MEKKKPTPKKAAKKPAKKVSAPKPKKETRKQKIDRETAEKKALVLKVYEKKAANVSATCIAANIGRRTFYYWRESDPDFDAACKDIEEALVDFAESMLVAKIQDKDLTAIIFYLKTKGKDRGYVERTENNVSMGPFIDAMKDIPDPPKD